MDSEPERAEAIKALPAFMLQIVCVIIAFLVAIYVDQTSDNPYSPNRVLVVAIILFVGLVLSIRATFRGRRFGDLILSSAGFLASVAAGGPLVYLLALYFFP